ncbi:MAG TPA: hypothetical protein VGK73_23610 [Polyangiaceae bacterium]
MQSASMRAGVVSGANPTWFQKAAKRLASLLAPLALLGATACGSDALKVPTSTCAADGLGCACSEEVACKPPYQCSDTGVCEAGDCTPGELDCTCTTDGDCDEGLACNDDNVCGLPDGSEGGACFSNGTCDAGLRCVDDVCEVCTPGREGCECEAGDACRGELVCEDGVCTTGGPPPEVPENPLCYSPCRQSFTDDGGDFHECSAEGLTAGCLNGRECVEGSCVGEDDPEPTECEGDAECPDFQTCIEGQCYANCDGDADCGGILRCYRKVCRTPCTASEDSCPNGKACRIGDEEHGFCMPLTARSGELKTSVMGTFALSVDDLNFSNVETVKKFTITNDAPRSVQFVLKRVQETTYEDGGPVIVTEDALPFLSIGEEGNAEKRNEYEFLVPAGETFTLEVSIADSDEDEIPSKWDGLLELSSELGIQRISLSYARRPDGRWAGKVYYFTQFGDLNLEAWRQDPNNADALSQVGNAFIRKWGDLRQKRISVSEMQAVVTSTVAESWAWASIQQACTEQGDQRCYPNSRGIGVYTNDPNSAPIPMGSVEFPMAFDLKIAADDEKHFTGRIPSSEALHYPGDPQVDILFEDSPADCSSRNDSGCLAFIKGFSTRVVVGGRYVTDASDTTCSRADGFQLAKTPFIVQGFTANTSRDDATGLLYRNECRDTLQPFGADGDIALNRSYAGSNPIPDGRSRVRTVELIDGALIEADALYLIFREHFESFLGDDTEGFSSYGLMVLRRGNADLSAEAFEGSNQTEERAAPQGVLDESVACPSDLVEEVLGVPTAVSDGNASDLALGLITGRSPATPEPSALDPADVHYLCHDTGLFDQGPDPAGIPQSCPLGSGVTFFTGTGIPDIASVSCQDSATCGVTLSEWEKNGSHAIQMNPVWRCEDTNQVYCDTDRVDLRNGKRFFAKSADAPVFVPLLPAIDDAFRYKTRFKNREGTNVGFAPQICRPNSNAIPYCYDPPAIESIRQRVDCLTVLFTNHYDVLSQPARDAARAFLRSDMSCDRCDVEPLPPDSHDGFERLYAELLVMLGDESYTAALKSRFDLAEVGVRAFEGSKFEPPNGIDLSGVAGFEMYKLYQAAQYYELVLDRFYSMSPYVWKSIKNGGANNFITQRTVTLYFNRVLRASTQRARTWSEIGKRYQAMNQPNLARRVVERAYSSSYIEAIALSRMMQSLVSSRESLAESERAQVEVAMSKAATTYRAALLDMREVYAKFTDQVTYFGFAPDYVPLPALAPSGPNAFETILSQAQEAASTAAAKEDLAIESNRSFDTDSAAFQSELTSIRNNYEDQLAQICGTFTGEDGFVYPAIRKYAYLSERTRTLGDPCGFVGNGDLNAAMAGLEDVQLDAQGVLNGYTNLTAQVENERERVSKQCDLIAELADYTWEADNQTNNLEKAIRTSEAIRNGLERAKSKIEKVAEFIKCSVGTSTDCPTATLATTMVTVANAAFTIAVAAVEYDIGQKTNEIADIRAATTRWTTLHECDVAQAESETTVKNLLLGMKDLDLEALKTNYRIRLALATIEGLHNQATRLAAEQEEGEQLAINLEAARNDPNVRIYKNDAVLNADRTFYSALSEAYRATKVYEYYTSQSYEGLVRLGLVRMVSRGDFNLENYLSDLGDAYSSFLEEAGRPDQRVDVLSLRDDVLQIPRYADDGRPLTESERVGLFRETLGEPKWLDAHGHRVFPFATALSRLSPLTRNHKISYVEAEIVGSSVGDAQGRVYLSQNGTATVHALDDSKVFYRFPPRLAVINPFFNGVRVFPPEVYRNDRLRDRPYANSSWEFVLNQRDELVNEDVDMNSLTDIRVFVYYQDFTAL